MNRQLAGKGMTGAAILAAACCVWLVAGRLKDSRMATSSADSLAFEIPVARIFGIAIDSFTVETGTVGRNQTLGQILEHYSIPDRSLNQLILYGSNVFDLRKLRSGNAYTAFLSKDTVGRLTYLVYEHSPVDYVVFDFRDSLHVSMGKKEITIRQQSVSGSIETSLWESIRKSNINTEVALELSEIYAWTVDFFGLQPKDSFSVIYDELFVDTVSVGLGEIHAAYFRHGGKDIYAIPFIQDSVRSYFDSDGNSLRRAFLKAPLRFNRISSRYSGSRLHPILKIVRPHYGVDYAAPLGTPVYTIGDGTVIEAGYEDGSGRIVRVRHNSVYTTSYMHLSSFADGIRAGVQVRQGDLIGYVGSSGLSTGPHLDFRVYRNGSPIDPLKMESPPVDPVKPEYMPAFDSVKMAVIQKLDKIRLNAFEEPEMVSSR